VARNALRCRDRAIGEGLARGNNLSKGFAACDPRICHPGRAPDMRDDFFKSVGPLPCLLNKGRGETITDMQSSWARRGT